jgi:hypothetical protein
VIVEPCPKCQLRAPCEHRATSSGDDEPVSVVPFPTLHRDAFYGLPGKIVAAVLPYTEAHPAALLAQYLAEFGAHIGPGAHLRIANERHPALLHVLILGRSSDGAKGTSAAVARALFNAAEQAARAGGARHETLRRVSGLSSGEGLLDLVRDSNGKDPDDKTFDEGERDKRVLVVEQEYVAVLSVMDRNGNTLSKHLRDAWDFKTLQTVTRANPLKATNAHIVVIGQATPGEFKLKLKEGLLLGGTVNRNLLIASRRSSDQPHGGNIPVELLAEYGPAIAETIGAATRDEELLFTDDALSLWEDAYPQLVRARPDGPVAQSLSRARPQVKRIALAYALADGGDEIGAPHLQAALALWQYVEDTAEWLFGAHVDTGETEGLLRFIAEAGTTGRTRTEISVGFFQRHKKSAEITAVLGELMKDGRVRQETDSSGPGRPTARYYRC